MVSIGPPGGNGTIILIGRSGYFCCAAARLIAGNPIAAPAMAERTLRLVAMTILQEVSKQFFMRRRPAETYTNRPYAFSPKAPHPPDKRDCRRSADRRRDPWQGAAGRRDRPDAPAARPAWPAPSKATSPPCSRP